MCYGKPSDVQGNNIIGRLLKHYDTAGKKKVLSYNILGQVLQESRRYLTVSENVDWSERKDKNNSFLEKLAYLSGWTHNALGETIIQMDACENERRTFYDLAGQVSQISLRMKDQEREHILNQGHAYAANGQIKEEKLNAGAVVIEYNYEETTQRLKYKAAKRVNDGTILQSLYYCYDPIGNIVSIRDQTKAIDYYKNAKAEPINHYVYDSLYQLHCAEGIESAQVSRQGANSESIVFGNKDPSRLVNYQRNYSYDAGGNLDKIAQGSNSIVNLSIDTKSNRGIEKRKSGPSLQESFDGNGNLLYLNLGQPLVWDSRNQLQHAFQIKRKDGLSDQESYIYDSQGNRVQKTRIFIAENQIHTERVRYLPGLEVREHWQTNLEGENLYIKEKLCCIQVQSREAVKCLHWEKGRPNKITNDSIHYSLSDQIGSHQLQLNEASEVINYESYYPYGGTAIWAMRSQIESNYKYYHYSGKERDATGLYYYGYRYYLPCLGRWLNPDPSGLSDGLNLFRMTHNNPITFYDSDGKVPIISNFKAERGDLVYGLAKERSNYVLEVFKHNYSTLGVTYEVENKLHPALVIDSYNNAITHVIMVENFDKLTKYREKPKKLAKKIQVPENLQELVLKHRPNYGLWKEYFALGEEDKKFNVAEIYRETAKKYGSDIYYEMAERSQLGVAKLIWKRGSKLGLKIAELGEIEGGMHIHFALDRLDIKEIVLKKGSGGVSVTASELRYINRNWKALEGKIHFYRNSEEVDAPWVEDQELWNNYQPKNTQATSKSTGNLLNRFKNAFKRKFS